MSYNQIFANGTAVSIALAAADSIAVKSEGSPKVYQIVGYPNLPNKRVLQSGTATGDQVVYGAYSAAATLEIEADEYGAKYVVGVAPTVEDDGKSQLQGAPGALNATGTLTPTLLLGGVVTTTAAAAVTATLANGTAIDAATELAIGDSFDWSVINTGTNIFTVTASAGSSIVGKATVASAAATTGSPSAMFRTRKSAAATFINYRIS